MIAELRELVAVSEAESARYQEALQRAAAVVEAALSEGEQAAPQAKRTRAGERGLQSIGLEADDVGRKAADREGAEDATDRMESNGLGSAELRGEAELEAGSEEGFDLESTDADLFEDAEAVPEPQNPAVPKIANPFAAEPEGGEAVTPGEQA